MKYNFPYLNDRSFLIQFNTQKLKQKIVKIIVLSFEEMPIQEIQGLVVGGSINVNGSSSMRRTANINMVVSQQDNKITDIRNLLSINKKVDILIGFKNTTGMYKDYPIIWFPQGTYVIIAPNISYDFNGINVSLTLHDKMALLNGECGGVLPAAITFSEMDDVDEFGNQIIKQPTIFQIIFQLVNHFGKQQLGKIIINDLPERIKKVVQWTGINPLVLTGISTSQQGMAEILDGYQGVHTQIIPQGAKNIDQTTYQYGDDVGYVLQDFTYPGELVSGVGQTITSVLDNIVQVLGNYEYFYDIEGNFRFQQIKNYMNTSYASDILADKEYINEFFYDKSIYNFNQSNIITAYNNTPQYLQIKNDFLIWGIRSTESGQQIPIRYHLAIDEKPSFNYYNIFFYEDPNDGIKKAKCPIMLQELPQFQDYNMDNLTFGKIKENGKTTIDYTKISTPGWTGKVGQYYVVKTQYTKNLEDKRIKLQQITSSMKDGTKEDSPKLLDTIIVYKWDIESQKLVSTANKIVRKAATDYRTELYFQGVVAQASGLTSNEYYTQLKNEWPKIYDVENGTFYEHILEDQGSKLDYFLDIIDANQALTKYGINQIGKRTQVISNNSINCIFQPTIKDIIFICAGQEDTDQLRTQAQNKGYFYIQIDQSTYSLLAPGGRLRSAYEEIRKELFQFLSYNEQISLTILPIYYLEPNTRINVMNRQSDIYGSYIINSFSIPFGINETMTLSCSKALERI